MSRLNDVTSEFKLARAKAQLIIEQPFYATLACTLPMIRQDDVGTMATNGSQIFWADAFVQEMTHNEVVFVLCHEILHCVFQHCERRFGRDGNLLNEAADYIINKMLVEEGIGTMPKRGFRDDALVTRCGGALDRIYDELKGRQTVGADSGGGFDQLLPTNPDIAQATADAAQVRVAVAQAAAAARMAGKLSANLKRLLGDVLQPRVNWKQVLRDFVAAKSKTEYSYSRLNRRFLHDDMFLPSLAGERLGDMVVAVDCSGSIGSQELNEFAAEITTIHTDMKPTSLTVMYFDSVVAHVDVFGSDDQIKIAPHGGGGTAFSPIFKEITKRDLDPVGVVVLTDLYCGDFGPAPQYPVLWVCNSQVTGAPWGQVVSMNK